MSDPAPSRLAELQRQRALVATHLAWLDAQIAATRESEAAAAEAAWTSPAVPASPEPPPAAVFTTLSATPAPQVTAATTVTAAPEVADDLRAAADTAAERILAEYRAVRPDVRSETRRGCLLYLAILVTLLAALLGGWWLLRGS